MIEIFHERLFMLLECMLYIPFEHVELLRCGMRDDGCEGCE